MMSAAAAAAAAACPHAGRLGAWCRRVPPLATVLLLSVAAAAAVLAAGSSSSSGDKVYLLNAMYSMNSYTVNIAKATWLGMDAAFYHADYTAADGRRIEIVEPSSSVNQSDIVAVVKAALVDYPSLLGVLGPYSDRVLLSLMSSSTLMSSSLMFLAPYTSSSAVRTWNDNVYFMRAEPRLEIMAIVQYIANTLRARRTAFMYLSGTGYGNAEYAAFVSLMTQLSLSAPALYTAVYSTTSTAVDTTAFDALADTYPQVIVLWSIPGLQTENFLKAVLTDPRTSSAYIITSFALQQTVFNVYYKLASAGTITAVAGQVLSSATSFPLSSAESTTHVPMFMAQMSKYMKNTGNVNASLWADEAMYVAAYGSSYASASGSSSYADAFLYEHPNVAQLMLVGWLAGTLIMQTLDESKYISSTATYQAGLFEQHRYLIGGDFALGDYGGPCDSIAMFLGAVCYCNQGGHAAFIDALSNASWTFVVNSGVNYTQNSCYSAGIYLPAPINFLSLVFEDHAQLGQASLDFQDAITSYIAYLDYTTNPVNYASLSVTEATASTLLDIELANYTTSLVASAVVSDLNVNGYLVSSPIFSHPHLVQAMKNYVYLMPTLEQQFYLLYQNLAAVQGVSGIGSSVQIILRGFPDDEAANMTTVLKKSAATFNYDDPTVVSVPYANTIPSSLAAGTINLMVGMTVADVAEIATFISSDTEAIVIATFDDLLLQYTTVNETFASLPTSVQARFLSFSNLPLWSDTSAAAQTDSPLLGQFFGTYTDTADYTPSKLLGVLVTAFLLSLVSTMNGVNTALLVSNIYLNGVISVYGMTFGTFEWSCTTSSSGETCTYVNYGAQSIVMLSAARMLDPTVPALTTASTPSMVYSARRHSGLTAAQRSGVIAGSVIGGVLLIAGVVLLVYCCSDSRDNDAAPKEGREPVTLIFTDIESSTAMWAALPQVMADAIASHHRVIRQLIKKYGCYEVKTVGDSFMIACKDAYSAVQLASDIQRRLLEYDWGTTEIDSTYREFELAKVGNADDYQPTTARLSEEEYAALWAGLRVRIGVHTGLSDIRYDEVTKGYDYYGDTSNMAARTEAIANGGQVVATEITWWALSDVERDATAHTAMGPQGLRGVPHAVEMYQLNPVPGRTHAALRTEIEAALPDDGAAETASSAADALLSSAGTMTGAVAGAALILSSTFALSPPAQRLRELQPLLNRWNVGAPPRPRQVSEEDYCQGLINRLAIRIANVTQVKQRLAAGDDAARASSHASGAPLRVNPLRAATGSLGEEARTAGSPLLLPPRFCERSAMRESRLLHRRSVEAAVLGDESRTSAVSARRVGRSATVGWPDAVVPFAASVVVGGSHHAGGGNTVFRSNSTSLDPGVSAS